MSRHFSEPEHRVTPKAAFLNRRQIIKAAGAASVLSAGSSLVSATENAPSWLTRKVQSTVYRAINADDELTIKEDATSYNNFYEFGTGKDDPKKYAHEFDPYPWEIEVGGECDSPGRLSLEDLVADASLEERIYRLRCVEAWSMVIPWTGIQLSSLLKRFQPNSRAKYVAFETVVRKEEMRGQRDRFSFIDWPYVEGLRIDEAMHPLSFLAVGMYGDPLPTQNGAPVRLVIPWKYGFKSIKSIVSIRFVEKEPPTTWNLAAPGEYGFYSNVNPNRPHPRWSQATERRIAGDGNIERIPTAMYNGYTDVASLYSGMDLQRFY
ncbi:protein-methionine-sulfoxide reductase catalytic subunit MsrP [Reinekea blandensis]|uniref:Protein-methionine-sulfoxide reductase catalytic subunit MsrP n=1 Tax=Reinekea blandensis MED297 TaxID=314283 RepID=A4BJI5_9GAMM|nr:protein-methionine-sulfoxide reductase catalytic subunit MsrP [Reinekea blandensis]EAR07689.1 Sulfite oxidase and related enzyme [Reinekea sp. MED297] [Reinekea blandensis MED297]